MRIGSNKKYVTCHDWKGGMHKVPAEKLSFRPSVYGVVIKDDKILLSPQNDDGYDFPGGGMDLHETIEECLVREVKEETGLDVDPINILLHASGDHFYNLTIKKAFNTVLLFYVCTNPRGTISTGGFDELEKGYADEAEWIDLAIIEELKFYNPVDSPAIIKKALSLIS